MLPWTLVAALYVISLIGLHAVARDLQQAPIRTLRARLSLLFWPITIPIAWAGDLYDALASR